MAAPEAAYEPVKVPHADYKITPAVVQAVAASPQKPLPPPPAPIDVPQPQYDDVFSSPEPSYPTSMETSGRNSPEPVDDAQGSEKLNSELQLALQNKLSQQAEAERTKKKQNFVTRTFAGLIMIGGFVGAHPSSLLI